MLRTVLFLNQSKKINEPRRPSPPSQTKVNINSPRSFIRVMLFFLRKKFSLPHRLRQNRRMFKKKT